MSLTDIVQLTITLVSTAPTKAGFGRPLICGYHTKWLDRTRLYKDPADMVLDGFAVTDPLYLAAVAIKSQNPSPKDFKVGRLGLPATQKVDLIPTTPAAGEIYSGKINGSAFTYTADGTPLIAEVTLGLTTAITALALVTAADTTGVKTTSTTDLAGSTLAYTELTNNLNVKCTTTDPGIATDLAAIYAADKDWYGLYLVEQSEAIIDAAAAWVEGNARRLFAYDLADSDIANRPTVSSIDCASDLKLANYFRTGGVYSREVFSRVALAWMAQRFTSVAGSDTWAFKNLKGVNPTDPLSTADEAAVQGKNCNTYSIIAGSGTTYPGKVAGGEYFDQVRGIDALFARIQEAVIGLFQANEKIAYTNEGVEIVRGTIQAILNSFARAPINFLSQNPAPICTAPRVEDVDASDKAARLLPDITFSATLAGAIHAVEIRGTVVV